MSGGDHAEGQLRQRRPRAGNADAGAPHPPDPRVGQARLGSRPPRPQSPWPSGAALSPLTCARSGGGGLPAPRPVRCARRQVPEPGEAPGRSSGDPPGMAPRWHGDRTAEARALSRDALCSGWDPGWPCAHVGAGARGGRGERAGSPPGCPAPPPRRAQALPPRGRKGKARVGREGDPGLGEVGGLTRVPPPPPPWSRASEPPPPAPPRAPRGPNVPGERRDWLWYRWAGARIPPRRSGPDAGASLQVPPAATWAPLPRFSLRVHSRALAFRPLCALGPAPLPL